MLGCLAIGGFLRFYNLGGPSIWVDELNHLYAGKYLLEEGSPKLPSGELYPRALPYSKLVSHSFQLFGVNEFSLRLPSAVVGFLCIPLVFLVAKRFFGLLPAALTALFMAISPFEIGWSRISRMYTLFQFFFISGVVAFYLGFESGGRDRFSKFQSKLLSPFSAVRLNTLLEKWRLNVIWLFVSIVCLVISFLVHQLTVLFLAGLLLYFVVMFFIQWRNENLQQALKSKYFILLSVAGIVGILAIVGVPKLRSFASYAILYAPKWTEMPKFQDRKLYLDFVFNNYNFPMGVLFVIGAYQALSRLHRFGIFALSVFLACIFMFTFVFSYRHLQYLYSVYPILIMLSAFAFANIVSSEFPHIKTSWFSKSKLSESTLKGLILCMFLVWVPLAPSLRLSKRIPFNEGGGFNGAIFLTEMRQACDYVRPRLGEHDLVISSDALATLYYLGEVDYNINFSDYDLAKDNNLKRDDGRFFDLYTGKPFVRTVSHFKHLMEQSDTIWLLSEEYKLLRASVYIPPKMREFVLSNFEKVFTTDGGSVLVFRYSKEGPALKLSNGHQ